MAKKTVEVKITAKDLTASVVAKFQRRWRAMERVVRKVTRAVVAFTAAATATVFTLTKLGERGDEVNAVKRAFARITGEETAALNLLRRAAGGAIEDFKLMALANQAITLGAAENVEQFAEMVEISRALGRAQGVDALHALESFTIGLARQSPRILDNIGLQIQLGDTTTFAARAMELARQKAAELTGGMEAATPWAQRFTTAIANLRDALSQLVADSPLIGGFFNELTDVLENLTDILRGDQRLLVEGLKSLGRIMGNAIVVGLNEALRAGVDKGNWFGRWFADTVFGSESAEFQRRLKDELGRLGVIAGLARGPVATGGLPAGAVAGGGGGVPAGIEGLTVTTFGGPQRRMMPSGFAPDAVARFRENRARRTNPRFGRQHRPEAGPVSALVGLTPDQQAAFDARNAADTVRGAAEEVEHAKRVVAASMFGMAQAAIRGSGQVAESVVGMITQISQSLPGVGGLLGTVIGGVGGLIGAAISRGRDKPVPVRLQEVDEAAAKTLQGSGEPIRITTIIESGGVEIERIERDLIDRSNRDEVVRYSQGRALAGSR